MDMVLPYLAIVGTILVFIGLVLLVVLAWKKPIETLVKGIVVPLIFVLVGLMFWVLIWTFGWMTPWLSNTGVSSLEKIVQNADSRTFECEYHGESMEGKLEDWYKNFDPEASTWRKFLRLNRGIQQKIEGNPNVIWVVNMPISVTPPDDQIQNWCHEDWFVIGP